MSLTISLSRVGRCYKNCLIDYMIQKVRIWGNEFQPFEGGRNEMDAGMLCFLLFGSSVFLSLLMFTKDILHYLVTTEFFVYLTDCVGPKLFKILLLSFSCLMHEVQPNSQNLEIYPLMQCLR